MDGLLNELYEKEKYFSGAMRIMVKPSSGRFLMVIYCRMVDICIEFLKRTKGICIDTL